MDLRQISAIAAKEWRETVRDRIYFMLAFILPTVLMFVFGYGVTQDVQHVPLAIVDEDRSAMSRDYAHHFIASHYFDFKGYLANTHAIDAHLLKGDVAAVLTIPRRFEERLLSGESVEVPGALDGTFIERIHTVYGYIDAINRSANAELQASYLARRLGADPDRIAVALHPVRASVRYLYNQDLQSAWGVASSMMMFILLLTAPLLTALSVVREKETGSIYNIYASNIGRWEFLLGKLVPTVSISFANGMILWLIAVWYFGAPFRGDALFFAAMTWVYVVCVSSIGLLISLVVATQQGAMIISLIFAVVTGITFSGMATPVESLTGANYVIAHLLPAMYYENIVRGSFLRGTGGMTLWRDTVALVAYSAVLLGFAHGLFHKRVRT